MYRPKGTRPPSRGLRETTLCRKEETRRHEEENLRDLRTGNNHIGRPHRRGRKIRGIMKGGCVNMQTRGRKFKMSYVNCASLLVRGLGLDGRRDARLIRLLPAQRAQAPTVARRNERTHRSGMPAEPRGLPLPGYGTGDRVVCPPSLRN